VGAILRFGSLWFVKLNPRNFRAQGRDTALFSLLTLSFSFVAMKSLMLSITRSPARSLRT
jgi:hypothetical protein